MLDECALFSPTDPKDDEINADLGKNDDNENNKSETLVAATFHFILKTGEHQHEWTSGGVTHVGSWDKCATRACVVSLWELQAWVASRRDL